MKRKRCMFVLVLWGQRDRTIVLTGETAFSYPPPTSARILSISSLPGAPSALEAQAFRGVVHPGRRFAKPFFFFLAVLLIVAVVVGDLRFAEAALVLSGLAALAVGLSAVFRRIKGVEPNQGSRAESLLVFDGVCGCDSVLHGARLVVAMGQPCRTNSDRPRGSRSVSGGHDELLSRSHRLCGDFPDPK